jgi:hypothetical protein
MRENSRIRFNPVTKEIEIEGSESFVKIYFKKLQVMVFGLAEKTVAAKKEPKPVKGAPVKTDKKELKLVNYPTHRAGHLKNLMRGLHPPYPRSAFIPVHRTGYSAGGFHKAGVFAKSVTAGPAVTRYRKGSTMNLLGNRILLLPCSLAVGAEGVFCDAAPNEG